MLLSHAGFIYKENCRLLQMHLHLEFVKSREKGRTVSRSADGFGGHSKLRSFVLWHKNGSKSSSWNPQNVNEVLITNTEKESLVILSVHCSEMCASCTDLYLLRIFKINYFIYLKSSSFTCCTTWALCTCLPMGCVLGTSCVAGFVTHTLVWSRTAAPNIYPLL